MPAPRGQERRHDNRIISLGAVTANRTGTGSNDAYAGGLVGLNEGTIRSSYSRAAVTATSHDTNVGYAGGFVGHNRGTIAASFATGNVAANRGTDTTGAAGNTANAGGFVGYNQRDAGNNYLGTITAAYATGNVAAVGKDTQNGRFAGVSNGPITASYSLGKPSATTTPTADDHIGGFVAYHLGGAITNSYWDTATSRITATGQGTGKTTTELQTPTTTARHLLRLERDVDGASGGDKPLGLRNVQPIPRP